MKKLQFAALTIEAIALLIQGCNRFVSPLPDWTLRLSGVIMLIGIGLLAFASVRLTQANRKER